MGHKAIALTDMWGSWGIARFYSACIREGMQPIVGARLEANPAGWLILLAKGQRGYANICRLLSLGLGGRRKGAPGICLDKLEEFAKGVICICACQGSHVRALASRGDDRCVNILYRLRKSFGEKDLYIDIQNNIPSDRDANELLEEAAWRFGIGTVALNHVAFLESGDFQIYRILVQIQKRHHHKKDVLPLPNDTFSLLSEDVAISRLEDQDLVSATTDIAARCQGFSFPKGRFHPPIFRKKRGCRQAPCQSRDDLPDIDIDFDSERRDEITKWLIRRFSPGFIKEGPELPSFKGQMQAALVSTVHTMRVRAAVRLSARAMDYHLRDIDRLSRCLPWSLIGIPLIEAMEGRLLRQGKRGRALSIKTERILPRFSGPVEEVVERL